MLPAQHRSLLDPKGEGTDVYVTLGEYQGTLSIYHPDEFEQRAAAIETEYMDSAAAKMFELQFYATASTVDMDKQGRLVLPERFRKKAKLGEEVFLVGLKQRIDIWNRNDFDRAMGINWADDSWPDWSGFLRMRPGESARDAKRKGE